MRFLGGWACASVCLVVASCGFPRPAHIPEDGAAPSGDSGDDAPSSGDDARPSSPYELVSIEPALATTGDTLTIEGTFASSATVHFPGGAAQAAIVLGDHRVTVVVPSEATTGDLTVTTGGDTVGPLSFRRTSFPLGIQQFRVTYEQADGGRQSPVLRAARSSPTASVVKDAIYVVGGNGTDGALNSVERAAMNADGTINSFTTVADVTLTEARARHTATVIGSSLLVIGGAGSNGALRSVERAAINADGSLGRFATVDNSALVTPRSGHTSVIVGNAIYVIGGAQRDGTQLATIERALIRPDGTIGSFALVPDITLTTPRSDHATQVIGSALYVFGGDTANGVPSTSIERATINPDGTLGAFTPAPRTQLTAARKGHRIVAVGNAIHILGGSSSGGVLANVESAPVGTDRVLGMFAAAPDIALTTPRTGHAIASVGGSIYVIGGSNSGGLLRTVERASLNAGSALDSLTTLDVSLALPTFHGTSTVLGNFVYVTGGNSDETSIQRASVHPDGTIDSFALVPGAPLMPRDSHSVAVIGSSLYVIGGSARLATIERAAINGDGSLGAFTAVPVTLNQGRVGHVSIVLGDFLYVIGGSGTNRLASVERSAIQPDGSLGPFVTLASVALNTARAFFTVVSTDKFLYVVGGFDEALSPTASIERASVGADGSLGAFAPVSVVNAARATHASAVVGRALYVFGGLQDDGPVSSLARAIINPDGSLGLFSEISGMGVDPRARHTATTVGNSVYLIGGETLAAGGGTINAVRVEHATLR